MSKEAFGINPSHWDSLDEETKELYRVVRPMRTSDYVITVHLGALQRQLNSYAKDAEQDGGVFQMNPDFQRGNVWSREKQISYVENLIRGTAPTTIKFNCAWFNNTTAEVSGMHGYDMVCVDGLQRVTSIIAFMNDEFKIFNNTHSAETLRSTPFNVNRYALTFEMYDIKDYGDLLQFYIDLNTGGVVHSDEEIARVKGLQENYKQIVS